MKKIFSLLIILCLLVVSAIPAFAEEEAKKTYETVYRWNLLYVDVDVSVTDSDLLISTLHQSGLVERVLTDNTSFAYVGEQEPNIVYFSININTPYEENNAAVRALLQKYDGVKGICQPVYARLTEENNAYSDLERIIINVDREKCDLNTVAADLRAIPNVHSVEHLQEKEGELGEVIVLCVDYPVEENCANVLNAVQKKGYIKFATIEMLAEQPTLPFMEEKEEPEYEIIHYWFTIYVDLDTKKCDPDQVVKALNDSGFVDNAWIDDSSPVYIGETDKDVAYLVIRVRLPYRENNEKIVSYLNQYKSAILEIYQPVVGCLDNEENGYFSFESILIGVDLSQCDEDTALQELSVLPYVHFVENTKNEEDDDPLAIFHVTVEYPFVTNGPTVLMALQKMNYVTFAQFERLVCEDDKTLPYGDVNCDGTVSADDARKILRFSVCLDRPGSFLEEVLSDMDCDGSVTAADARLALRTAVGLNPKNLYTYSAPKYAGLLAGTSIELTKKGDTLLLAASTTGTNKVTKCGFNYIKLQKMVNGVWTDIKEYTYLDQFNNTNSKVFSVFLSAPKGNTYRAVCEHYAEVPYLQFFTQSAIMYNTSKTVKM